MKLKHTGRCIVFILILLLILSLGSRLFGPKNIHAAYGLQPYRFSGVYGEPENTLDVVMVGDSVSYMGLSPMEMWDEAGIASFVCGNDQQLPPLAYENLREIFKTQSPRLVVVETDELYLGLEPEDRLRSRLRIAFPMLSYHDMWRKVSPASIRGARDFVYIDDSKGYYPIFEVDSEPVGDYMTPGESRTEMDETTTRILLDILELCRENNAELLLLSVPCPHVWDYSHHAAMEAFAEEHGVHYLDLNLLQEEAGIDWSIHTRDGGYHLNHDGAVVVSRYLARWLHENLEIPDRRQDPAYGDWHLSYENYRDWLQLEIDHRAPLLRGVPVN